MYRWCFGLRRCGMSWPTLTEDRIFERTGVVNLGPASSTFLATVEESAAKPTAWTSSVWMQTASWRAGRKFLFLKTTLDCLKPIPGYCTAKRPLRPGLISPPKRAAHSCSTVRSRDITHHAEGSTVTTSEGEYNATRLLVSAGTWVTKLLPDLPIQPVRKVFSWFQSDGRYSSQNKFPAFTGELPNGDQFYGFPSEKDALKIGKHNGGQVISSAEERKPYGAYPQDGSEAFTFLRNILPGVGGLLYGAACTYDNTPDEDFIIDTLPGHDNTLLVTGLSGHGFKFASVLGEIAAQFAQGIAPSFDLKPFALSRFNR